MGRPYKNPWIPEAALNILRDEKGSILDVGGSAPFFRATHILDVAPFDPQGLQGKCWGGEGRRWTEDQYTLFDLCSGKVWPFKDKTFDLGLCSHTLEDLRDPLPAVKELLRVCRKVLIICPSRLLEQTRGISHPRFCGFEHHPWLVFVEDGVLVFRRKTPIVEFPACHISVPPGCMLEKEKGSMCYYGDNLKVKEWAPWNPTMDYEEYCKFIAPYKQWRHDLFVHDGKRHDFKYWVWCFRQRFCGAV